MSESKHLQDAFLQRLSVVLRKHGFVRGKDKQTSYWPKPFGWAAFHVALIPHKDVDFDITADVALRYEAVENLVNADNELLSKTQKGQTATIGCEIGNLTTGRQRRWTIASEANIESVLTSIEDALVLFALPYIQKYSDANEVFTLLSSNERSAWLHSPIHSERCQRAIALAVILGKDARLHTIIHECQSFLTAREDLGLARFEKFIQRISTLPKGSTATL